MVICSIFVNPLVFSVLNVTRIYLWMSGGYLESREYMILNGLHNKSYYTHSERIGWPYWGNGVISGSIMIR